MTSERLIKALVGVSGVFFPISWVFLAGVLPFNQNIPTRFCSSGFYLYTTVSLVIIILSFVSFYEGLMRYLAPHVALIPLFLISIKMYLGCEADPVILLSYSVLISTMYAFLYFYIGLIALSRESSSRLQNSVYGLVFMKLLLITVGFFFMHKYIATFIVFPGEEIYLYGLVFMKLLLITVGFFFMHKYIATFIVFSGEEIYLRGHGAYYVLISIIGIIAVFFSVRTLSGLSEEVLSSPSSITLSEVMRIAWPIVSVPGYLAAIATVITPRFSAVVGMWIRGAMAVYTMIVLPTIFYATFGLILLLDIYSS